MNKWFMSASDATGWFLAQWYGFFSYVAVSWLTFWWFDWDGIDRFIYISGAYILVLRFNADLREGLAIQKKLDSADPEHHEGIENKDPKEIRDCD